MRWVGLLSTDAWTVVTLNVIMILLISGGYCTLDLKFVLEINLI